MGQYLGQIDDLQGKIGKTLAGDLQLSERAHLAYQALSRGAGQAHDWLHCRGRF